MAEPMFSLEKFQLCVMLHELARAVENDEVVPSFLRDGLIEIRDLNGGHPLWICDPQKNEQPPTDDVIQSFIDRGYTVLRVPLDADGNIGQAEIISSGVTLYDYPEEEVIAAVAEHGIKTEHCQVCGRLIGWHSTTKVWKHFEEFDHEAAFEEFADIDPLEEEYKKISEEES